MISREPRASFFLPGVQPGATLRQLQLSVHAIVALGST